MNTYLIIALVVASWPAVGILFGILGWWSFDRYVHPLQMTDIHLYTIFGYFVPIALIGLILTICYFALVELMDKDRIVINKHVKR